MVVKRWEILENLIVAFGCKSIVEVGVRKGDIAIYLLDSVRGIEKYYIVDIDFSVLNLVPIQKYGSIVSLHNMSSVLAAKEIPDDLDMVFIDAEHSYEACKEDIEAWLPKVRNGGIICGHDYCDDCPGIAQAVHECLGSEINLEYDGDVNIWWTRK